MSTSGSEMVNYAETQVIQLQKVEKFHGHQCTQLGQKTMKYKQYSKNYSLKLLSLLVVTILPVSIDHALAQQHKMQSMGILKISIKSSSNNTSQLIIKGGGPSIGHGCTHVHPIILANEIEVSRQSIATGFRSEYR